MKLALLFTGLCILYTAVYIAGQGHPEQMVVVTDVLFAITSFIPVIAGVLLTRKYGLKGVWPSALAAMTLGLFLSAIGETIWFFLEVVQGVEIPYPSIADAFYIGGLIPMIVGMSVYIRPFRAPLVKSKIALILAIAGLAALLSFYPLLEPLAMAETVLINL
jgi:hypothetical protein